MRAALQTRYGSPDVLHLIDRDAPALGPREIRVRVRASAVTRGDRRLRAADFPGIGWLPGRLVSGLFRPRHRTPGTVFAGQVEAVGAEITRFAVGDDVFGQVDAGAYAEQLTLPEDGIVTHMPATLDYAEAAATPYGALTALKFMKDLAQVQPGERVLIIGAAGGVGRFAVQIARHLGAEITAVCRPRSFLLAQRLGATHTLAPEQLDLDALAGRYDVIFDTPGVTRFTQVRQALTARGRYLTLSLSVNVLWHMMRTRRGQGRRALFGIALGSKAELEAVGDLAAQGVIHPVIAHRLPLDQLAEAHDRAARPGLEGAVTITM